MPKLKGAELSLFNAYKKLLPTNPCPTASELSNEIGYSQGSGGVGFLKDKLLQRGVLRVVKYEYNRVYPELDEFHLQLNYGNVSAVIGSNDRIHNEMLRKYLQFHSIELKRWDK